MAIGGKWGTQVAMDQAFHQDGLLQVLGSTIQAFVKRSALCTSVASNSVRVADECFRLERKSRPHFQKESHPKLPIDFPYRGARSIWRPVPTLDLDMPFFYFLKTGLTKLVPAPRRQERSTFIFLSSTIYRNSLFRAAHGDATSEWSIIGGVLMSDFPETGRSDH